MLTLIGSRAMRHWFNDARGTEQADWDYRSPVEHDPDTFPVKRDWQDIFVDPRLDAWPWGPAATPSDLYTMKIRHSGALRDADRGVFGA